jgi:hypothetical protein
MAGSAGGVAFSHAPDNRASFGALARQDGASDGAGDSAVAQHRK